MRYLFNIIILLWSMQAFAQDKTLYIYQDADISSHNESSVAIQQGIEVAFSEIDNEVSGYRIAFKYLDHRGNVIRSKRNYQTFIKDPRALAIYSGIHSPPLIKNRDFINENKALTLVPWAAGGPITRYPSKENWIYRLSVDDTQAGAVIIDFAMNNKMCKKPHLLLEDTPWGSSNLKSMSKALKQHNIEKPTVTRFSWNLKEKGARTLLREIFELGSDCIVLVGNAVEGAVLAEEMANRPLEERLPIVSHWGITGGDFHQKINVDKRKKLDLHFIQSCFAFTNAEQSEYAQQVFKRLIEHSAGKITQVNDLKAAVGFIHAYDLTKLLIQAMKQTKLTGDMTKDRNALRLALENIQTPVQGLVKTYIQPFSIFDEQTNVNGHEALYKENYCMGKYGLNNEVLIANE